MEGSLTGLSVANDPKSGKNHLPEEAMKNLGHCQLQTGRLLLAVAPVFQRLFGQVIFPRLRIIRH